MTAGGVRFKKLRTDFGSTTVDEISEDFKYWRDQVGQDKIVKDFGSIDSIDYNPHNLDELLVTSLARCSIYNIDTLEVVRTFRCQSQFQVYGGTFRPTDGRLVAVGSEEGKIFIFESTNNKPIRTLRDEVTAPTRRVLFSNHSGSSSLVSFSDDQCVRLWDVGTGQLVNVYGRTSNRMLPTAKSSQNQSPTKNDIKISPEKTNRTNSVQQTQREETIDNYHKDYVRAGCIIDNLIVSGSYDHYVKVWDPRTDSRKPVMQYDHGRPLECLCKKGSSLIISVGGTKINVFDIVSGQIIADVEPNHSKTITTCANFDDRFLLTGSLDGHLNVFNFDYEYITRLSYDQSQILAASASSKMLAVGFSDHRLTVRKFKDIIEQARSVEKFDASLFGPHTVTRYFHEAIAESQDPEATRRAMLAIQQQKKGPVEIEDDEPLYRQIVISDDTELRPSLRDYEKYLTFFEHGKALDSVMSRNKTEPEAVVALLVELIKRNKLQLALRNCERLADFLRFLATNIRKLQYNRTLVDVAKVFVDMCIGEDEILLRGSRGDIVHTALKRLIKTIDEEVKSIESCISIRGQIDVILSQAG